MTLFNGLNDWHDAIIYFVHYLALEFHSLTGQLSNILVTNHSIVRMLKHSAPAFVQTLCFNAENNQSKEGIDLQDDCRKYKVVRFILFTVIL